jgi:hypothetical protein
MAVVHRIDETGNRYGRLVVIELMDRSLAERFKRAKAKWLCQCDCGKRTRVFGDKLRNGTVKNCLRCERAWRENERGEELQDSKPVE